MAPKKDVPNNEEKQNEQQGDPEGVPQGKTRSAAQPTVLQPIIQYTDPNADLQRSVLELQQRQLILQADQLEDEARERATKKATRRESLEVRERQLYNDRKQLKDDAKRCNHRQGGTRNRPLRGNGPTALKRLILPMGEAIRCGTCRGTWYKPHPYKGIPRQKDGESVRDMERRLDEFEAQKARFDELMDQMDQHAMTEEAAAPLIMGAEFRFYTADMQEVFPPRPNDTNALQYA
jgi:hypothetical protein